MSIFKIQSKKITFLLLDSYAYSKADIIIIDINLDVDKISTEKRIAKL